MAGGKIEALNVVKKLLLLATGLFAAAQISSAQTWTQTSAPSNYWSCVASSANGNILVAGVLSDIPSPIYVSTNSGNTWTQTSAPSNYWNSVASSADGCKLVAVSDGPIYISTNSGANWTLTGASNEYWGSVASSADGSKLVAVAPMGEGFSGRGMIDTSTNCGTTWTVQTNLLSSDWVSVASSADGNKLVAVVFPVGGFNGIYFSTNSGINWIPTITPLRPGGYASPSQIIASSADGTKWVAAFTYSFSVGSLVPIYTSTNLGDSWTLTSAPSNSWISVAMSADGNEIAAVVANGNLFGGPGPIYTSTNFGVSWSSNNMPSQIWSSVASSADGEKWVATSGFPTLGSVYTLQTTPRPQMNITPINSNLVLSWLVPSTNFVLQQSSNLVSWTDVTNSSVLNLTNLQNEVTLPLTNGSGFYRLKTP